MLSPEAARQACRTLAPILQAPPGTHHGGPACLAIISWQNSELGQDLLNVSFGVLLGDLFLNLSDSEKIESSSQWENVLRNNLQHMTHRHARADRHHSPVWLSHTYLGIQAFLEEGKGQNSKGKISLNWQLDTEGLRTFESPCERVCPLQSIFNQLLGGHFSGSVEQDIYIGICMITGQS